MTKDCEYIGIVFLLYSIYYIIERYVDPTRDRNMTKDCECIGDCDCISSYSTYYIIERYVDPARDHNRNHLLRL